MVETSSKILIIFFLSGLLACNGLSDKDNAIVPQEIPTKKHELADSVYSLLRQSSERDSLNYVAFIEGGDTYKLLYFRMGNLFYKNSKSVIAVYSVNDTTLEYLTFHKNGETWTATGDPQPVFIERFSPAFFGAQYEDFNFDGIADLYINIYTTMRVADSFGFILTFDPVTKSLKAHEESLGIANISIDQKSKAIISTEFSNPNDPGDEYKTESVYRWINDSLVIASRKKIPI